MLEKKFRFSKFESKISLPDFRLCVPRVHQDQPLATHLPHGPGHRLGGVDVPSINKINFKFNIFSLFSIKESIVRDVLVVPGVPPQD